MSDMGLWWGGPLKPPQRPRLESQLSQSVAQQQEQPEQGQPGTGERNLWQEPRSGERTCNALEQSCTRRFVQLYPILIKN